MRRRTKIDIPENRERWLLTYADLITLLLAFFVVMYSMSQLDAKRFGAMSSAFSGILRGQKGAMRNDPSGPIRGDGPLKTERLRLMNQSLQRKVAAAELDPAVSSEMTERGLVIHVREGALFEEAKAELTVRARAILRTIGHEIEEMSNHIRVEGHTDSRPIHTPRFPSNWELSTTRATAVLRFMVDSTGMSPLRISAIGFGEFRPIAPNDAPNRMAKNRRVDLVLLSHELARAEPAVADFLLDDAKGSQ